MPNILVATPAYEWSVGLRFMLSLRDLERRIARERPDTQIEFRCIVGSVIVMARNAFATIALNNKSISHLLFIDNDNGYRPEAVFRLLDSGKDFVGCLYPARSPANIIVSEDAIEPGQTGPLVRTRFLGCGLTLIGRTVFERIAAANPNLLSKHEGIYSKFGLRGPILQCFQETVLDSNGVYYHEDYALCVRWREIGGEIWAITDEPVSHFGYTEFKNAPRKPS